LSGFVEEDTMNERLWNVRGVDGERRKAAKIAAAAAGMTIGKWIERAIGITAAVEEGLRQGKSRGKSGNEVEDRVVFSSATSEAILTESIDNPKPLKKAQRAIEKQAAGEERIREKGRGKSETVTYDPLARENNLMLTTDTKFETPEKLSPGVRMGGPGQAFTYDLPKKRKAPKVCAHGTMKGNNCWQCGGLAAVV
jgi:hypothetical protein